MYGNYLDNLPAGLRFVGTSPEGVYIVVDGGGTQYEFDGAGWGRTIAGVYTEKYDPGSGESERILIVPPRWEPYVALDFPPARAGAWLIDPKFDNPGASWWNIGVSGSSAYKASSPSGQMARMVRAPDGSVMLELPPDAIPAGVTEGDGSGLFDAGLKLLVTSVIGGAIAQGASTAFDAASGALQNGGSIADAFQAAINPPSVVSDSVSVVSAPGADMVDDFFPVLPPASQVSALVNTGYVVDPLSKFFDEFLPAPVPAAELNLLPVLAPASAAGTFATGTLASTLAKAAGAVAGTVGGVVAKALTGGASKAPVAVVPAAAPSGSGALWGLLILGGLGLAMAKG